METIKCDHDYKYNFGAGCVLCYDFDISKHLDTGLRCLMDHGIDGQCIKCTCGKFIALKDWAEHKEKNNDK